MRRSDSTRATDWSSRVVRHGMTAAMHVCACVFECVSAHVCTHVCVSVYACAAGRESYLMKGCG